MAQTRSMSAFGRGLRDGVPIALGYFAVAFALGIKESEVGLTALQGFVTSILNHASAGEYMGVTLIAATVPYWEMALSILVTNARYLLMSSALSQKFAPGTSVWHRLGVGFGITDEIFGVTMAQPGYLRPAYNYAAMMVAFPGWATGTALGITVGDILPNQAVSALSVALYGMFLAVIIPAGKKDRVVAALVALSFAASWGLSWAVSWGAERLPGLENWLSPGNCIILLTLVLAGGAATLFPVKEQDEEGGEGDVG